MRLTSFYVTWPACTPSRGSLLTGRCPQRNGTYNVYRNDLVDFGVKYEKHRYAVSPEMIKPRPPVAPYWQPRPTTARRATTNLARPTPAA